MITSTRTSVSGKAATVLHDRDVCRRDEGQAPGNPVSLRLPPHSFNENEEPATNIRGFRAAFLEGFAKQEEGQGLLSRLKNALKNSLVPQPYF